MQNNKKILFVVTQSEMGGAQRFLAVTAPWLSEQGWEVIVAAGGNEAGELFSMLRGRTSTFGRGTTSTIGGPTSQTLKRLKRKPNPLTACLAIREIKQLLKKEKPDVLFLCSTMAGLLGSIAAKKILGGRASNLVRGTTSTPGEPSSSGLKVVYRIGGWAFNDPRPAWQKKLIILLEKWTSRFKDKIIVNLEYDLRTALKYKIAKPEKLVKIYNGLDPAKIKFLTKEEAGEKLFSMLGGRASNSMLGGRSSLGGPASRIISSQLIIGTIANFYKTKGLAYLIEAVKILCSRSDLEHNCSMFHVPCFMLIGDGPERDSLKLQIKDLKLENKIFLTGRLTEARKYLKAFDIFVLPSLKEGFPWVILEAIAAGVPIVAAKVGAVPEILENNKSALLVEPGNAEQIAKAIKKLLENPQLAQQLAQNAKARLSYFSEQKMLQQTLKLIV